MHTASWEDGHLARRQRGVDHFRTVLHDHVGVSGAFNRDDDVGGARMEVSRKHGAGTKVEHGECHSGADHSWEGGGVGVDDRPRRVGVLGGSMEVKNPVFVG